MINKVRISNFKGIKNIELNELSKFNIIGGKNNAGKSTVLEAIFMFYDRLGPEFLLKQYGWRGITELQITPEDMFFPIFNQYDFKKNITIEISTRSSLFLGRQEFKRVAAITKTVKNRSFFIINQFTGKQKR